MVAIRILAIANSFAILASKYVSACVRSHACAPDGQLVRAIRGLPLSRFPDVAMASCSNYIMFLCCPFRQQPEYLLCHHAHRSAHEIGPVDVAVMFVSTAAILHFRHVVGLEVSWSFLEV